MTETRMERIASIIAVTIVLSLITIDGFATAVFATLNNNATKTNQTTSQTPAVADSNDIATDFKGHNSIRVISVRVRTFIDAGGQGSAIANCPTGWVVTGGGFAGSGQPGVFVYENHPDGNPPTGWTASGFNTSPNNQVWNVYVVCARDDKPIREN